jgi:hypothetical protein
LIPENVVLTASLLFRVHGKCPDFVTLDYLKQGPPLCEGVETFKNGSSQVIFSPDYIHKGTGESVHGGDFSLILLNGPSYYLASTIMNCNSVIPIANNKLVVIGWGETISGIE